MKRNNFWKWMLVLFIVAWSIQEIYPPTSRDLVQEFRSRAVNRDTNFNAIVERVVALDKARPDNDYRNLLQAIGTNDVLRYFPFVKMEGESDPTRAVLNRLQQDAAGEIKLGLDLIGGTSFLVRMNTNTLSEATDVPSALSQAVEVLRRRVDNLGVAEPLIQPSGADHIIIAMPGLSDEENESARRQIEKAAFLEFRMVHPESDSYIKEGIPAPGYERLALRQRERTPGQAPPEPTYLLVKKKPERGLTGKHIKFATVVRHPVSNEPEIHFTLDDEGARKFAEITREFSPQGGRYYLLAIVLDGVLYSAPRINSEIPSGSASITGDFDLREAIELANVLENPLEAPVEIVEERRVDPSLGKDSIRSGLIASIVGTAAVLLFILSYYLFAGIVANIALLLNIVIMFGVMCSIDTTLTLPGIAGIVLSIGMAVDANVLIYERFREEIAAGKSFKGALAAAYHKAFGTILDSNLTTLISSIILIYMGTGPVRGFGITLTIGILASMFTALIVTRLIFDWFLEKELLKSLPMLQFFKPTRLDFMSWGKPVFVISWILVLIGLSYGVIRGKKTVGVDFLGGDSLTLAFAQKIDVDRLRNALDSAKITDSLIQYQRDISKGVENLRITVPFGIGSTAEQALRTQFPEAKFERLALDKVGPSIGHQILKSAAIASLLAMFGILIYVAMRYEFSFAVASVIAIIHDVLMTAAIFCLVGGQFNATSVAAILTIMGYSINDKIVNFDRIREDLKLGVRGTFREIINAALNKTLSRTVITGGGTMLSTLALFIFGGGVIEDFAFMFMVGIIVGTYSSIFIASIVVHWWHRGERPAIGASTVVVDTVPSVTKA